MSYINPNIPILENATGLLAAIQEIQLNLGQGLQWLDKSFGRAYLMPEKREKSNVLVPKVYDGSKEYQSVLPNDSFKSYSFIQVLGPEKTDDYQHTIIQIPFEVKIGIVFFLNLKKIDPAADFIYTDRLKKDVLKILKRECSSFTLEEVQDEKVKDIFEGYQPSVADNTLLMYPKAAMRFVGNLIYNEQC